MPASRLHVADGLLESWKGREVMDHYHFQTRYRLNTVLRIGTEFDLSGFSFVECRCFDRANRYQWYLPAQLQWFPPVHQGRVRLGQTIAHGASSFCAV
jgi:hypothetical protein